MLQLLVGPACCWSVARHLCGRTYLWVACFSTDADRCRLVRSGVKNAWNINKILVMQKECMESTKQSDIYILSSIQPGGSILGVMRRREYEHYQQHQ